MKRVALGLLIGILVLGGMAVPAEAGHWHHGHHHGHDHFLGGFLTGAATVLVLDALRTPRFVYRPPVVYEPVYYRVPVCRDVWIPGRWQRTTRTQGSFMTYYDVWVEGYWQRQCY